jgi:hypothetical protein
MSETFVYNDKCQLVNFQIETSSKGLQGISGRQSINYHQNKHVMSFQDSNTLFSYITYIIKLESHQLATILPNRNFSVI